MLCCIIHEPREGNALQSRSHLVNRHVTEGFLPNLALTLLQGSCNADQTGFCRELHAGDWCFNIAGVMEPYG